MITKRPSGPSTMYSGTMCDLCGGPTLAFPSGSIWCPDEDAHAGGHFVIRVAFERSPLKAGTTPVAIKPQRRVTSSRVARAPERPRAREAFSGGIDDFVSSDD